MRHLAILATQVFRKKFRICKAEDFKKVFQQGKKISTQNLHIYYIPNQLAFSRLGMSISKSVGGAVERSLRKRWIREAFRTSSIIKGTSFDIVVRLRNGRKEIDFQKIKEQFEGAIKQAEQKQFC